MESISAILSIIGAGILIIGAIVAVVVFVKGSYGKARMMALREDNGDLRSRIDDTEKELAIEKGRGATSDARITALESENELLRNINAQRADVNRITEMQRQQHEESMAVLQLVLIAVEKIAEK